jgi:drug/metabolite transporter superfamily protein YnfA
MEDHNKIITGGVGGLTLSTFFKLFHDIAGVASDFAAYGGAFLVIIGIWKWWKTRKEK